MALELERETTILFADILGGADLTAKAGDPAARGALAGCVEHAQRAAKGCGARVISRTPGKMMALIATPDAAADAAAAMHTAMDSYPMVSGVKLALGIGFHHGPVIQKGNEDVFGDTVTLAARLVELAGNGQIITTRETASHLSPLYRAWMRKLYPIDLKGRSGQVELCELVWRGDDNATVYARKKAPSTSAPTVLTLVYKDRKLVRRRDRDSVTIGRDPNCGIPIAEEQASRVHCTVEKRQDKFVLVDHSTNGTYVKTQGTKDDVLVQREEFLLSGKGTICCGQPSAATPERVEFSIE
jgi:adenylate cyclase